MVVINADKVHFTGRKWKQKMYRRHSGFPGGLKEVPAEKMLEKFPERIIRYAVNGMLPKNRLRREKLSNLMVYTGAEHPHKAQFPLTQEDQAALEKVLAEAGENTASSPSS